MKTIWIIASYKKEEIDQINRVTFDYVNTLLKPKKYLPIIIPCQWDNFDEYIELCDGFILPWGAEDVHPSLYKQSISWSNKTLKRHDELLMAYINKIIIANKKLLWICKWLQLINIYYGGTLNQDIETASLHNQYKEQYNIVHQVHIKPNSFLYKVYSEDRINVNSIHHQAIDKLWQNIVISWYCKDDWVIEAIEHKLNKNVLWIQWHPESLNSGIKLFDDFFKQI